MQRAIDIAVVLSLVAIIIVIAFVYRKPGNCTIDPTLEKMRQDLTRVDPRASKLQFFPSNSSYTEDKQKIFICMKDEQGNYYPYNTLLGVGLHELAHALTNVIDKEHKTPEFNNMHNYLRQRATDLGIYHPEQPVPPTYCPSAN